MPIIINLRSKIIIKGKYIFGTCYLIGVDIVMNKKIIFLCIIIAIIVVIMFFGFRGKNQNDNNNYTSFSDEVTFTSKSGGKTASNSLEIQEIKDKVSSYYSYSSDSSEMLKIVYGKKAKETTLT